MCSKVLLGDGQFGDCCRQNGSSNRDIRGHLASMVQWRSITGIASFDSDAHARIRAKVLEGPRGRPCLRRSSGQSSRARRKSIIVVLSRCSVPRDGLHRNFTSIRGNHLKAAWMPTEDCLEVFLGQKTYSESLTRAPTGSSRSTAAPGLRALSLANAASRGLAPCRSWYTGLTCLHQHISATCAGFLPPRPGFRSVGWANRPRRAWPPCHAPAPRPPTGHSTDGICAKWCRWRKRAAEGSTSHSGPTGCLR